MNIKTDGEITLTDRKIISYKKQYQIMEFRKTDKIRVTNNHKKDKQRKKRKKEYEEL